MQKIGDSDLAVRDDEGETEDHVTNFAWELFKSRWCAIMHRSLSDMTLSGHMKGTQ